MPERTYRRRLAKLRAGDEPAKGPWPTLAVDAAEALAAKYAADWPAWGHHKIAAMMRANGLGPGCRCVGRTGQPPGGHAW
jgi:putative transposase